jgi:DnaJ family protein C protein 28
MTTKRERKDWESWIDEQIREAQEKGQFDNLPGKGKPLDLAPNPYAGDREMAFKILREAGYAPEWIELDKAIRLRLERARTALGRTWQWYRDLDRELGIVAPDGTLTAAALASPELNAKRLTAERERRLAAWQAAVVSFGEEVAAINRQITELNLKVPSPRFQRSKVDAEREVQALVSAPEEGAA